MALVKKGDRCGKWYEVYGDQSQSNPILPVYIDKTGIIENKFCAWDLCTKCKEELEAWLNGGH